MSWFILIWRRDCCFACTTAMMPFVEKEWWLVQLCLSLGLLSLGSTRALKIWWWWLVSRRDQPPPPPMMLDRLETFPTFFPFHLLGQLRQCFPSRTNMNTKDVHNNSSLFQGERNVKCRTSQSEPSLIFFSAFNNKFNFQLWVLASKPGNGQQIEGTQSNFDFIQSSPLNLSFPIPCLHTR